jgi:uncharacterized protein (TIGR02231 family)
MWRMSIVPTLFSCLAVGITLLTPAWVKADEEAAVSRVTAVTVHLQQAVVTREVILDLAPGEHRVTINPLPAALQPESVRVRGFGTPGLKIRGVEVRSVHEEAAMDEESRSTEERIRDLTHRQALITERRGTIGVLREFVTGLKSTADETTSRDLLARGFATADWDHAFGFVSGHLDQLGEENERLLREYAELSRAIQEAQAGLSQTASRRATDRYAVEISVSAEKSGTARLAITYLVTGASWKPLYDARLDPAHGKVTIDALGQITQTTGEDWSDVSVILTTSRPLSGIDLPRLTSVRLIDASRRSQGGFIQVVSSGASAELVDALPVLGRNYQDVLTPSPGVSDVDGNGNPNIHGARDTETVAPAAIANMEVLRSELVMTFAIPGRLDIPSDGQPHQHLIASRDVDAKVEYQCVPALSLDVFAVARLTLPDDLSLLEGRMAHFVDGDLVGHSDVAPKSGGEELTLSFGPEPRLRAERRDTLLKTGRKGRDEERDRKVVTTLRNFLGRPVVVHVSDRVPVSGDDRIGIAIARDETTAALPGDPAEPGILKWDLEVPPSGKAEVTLRYRIRAPAGMLPAEP